MSGPFLLGDRVDLRPLDVTDAPRLVAILNDPAVRRTLATDRPISLAAEQEFITALARSKDQVLLGIAEKPGAQLAGVCGLNHLGDAARQAEFGIFLAAEAAGKGLGQEATRLIVGYGFDTLNLNRIWLHVFADNARAIHVYEKVGFRTEGVLRQAGFRGGRYLDVVSMALLRAEWR